MIKNLSFITIPICIFIGHLSHKHYGISGSIIALVLLFIIGFVIHLAAHQAQRKAARRIQH